MYVISGTYARDTSSNIPREQKPSRKLPANCIVFYITQKTVRLAGDLNPHDASNIGCRDLQHDNTFHKQIIGIYYHYTNKTSGCINIMHRVSATIKAIFSETCIRLLTEKSLSI